SKITHQEAFGFQRRDEEVSYTKMKDMLKKELEDYFRPEFINRLDEVIVFKKLTHDDLTKIIDLEVAKLAERLRNKGLELELTQAAKDFLIERGTDEKFGARPLRRAIEQYIEDSLSESILRNEYEDCDTVVVDAKKGETEDDLAMLVIKGEKRSPDKPEPAVAGTVGDAT
ncbi:MAG: NDP-hexose 4-ketoreductase, partial [Phycisphaerae bacterium]